MKKFEFVLIIIVIICVSYGTVKSFCSVGELRQLELNKLRENIHQNIRPRSAIPHYEVVLGKYVDSISDGMLQDFYPQVTNLDSLRSYLTNCYESQNPPQK